MFPLIFEVLPRQENWCDYLDIAKMLRPELEQIDGFTDNIRYKSPTREGWILSLSGWRDEKLLVACARECATTRSSRSAATKSWPITTCVSARSRKTTRFLEATAWPSNVWTRPRLVRERS